MAAKNSIRERLTDAASKHELVQVDRTIKKADRLEGFVVGLGKQWTLVHVATHDWLLNGYSAIRVSDVRRVKPWDAKWDFPARALAHFGQHAVALPDVSLDSPSVLIESAAAAFPLLTLYIEDVDPGVCFIGKPIATSDRKLRLLEIDPGAVWKGDESKWDLRDITRVDFGGRYEEALAALGGAPDPP